MSIQLEIAGKKPHPISLDDYFLDREMSPKDELGNYNFETIASLDTELFSRHMNQLLHGEKISMPSYNFLTGKREYRGHELQLAQHDVLVIEADSWTKQQAVKKSAG